MLQSVRRSFVNKKYGHLAQRCLSNLSSYEGLEVTQEDGLRIIKLNRPQKFNAFNKELYLGVQTALENAAGDYNTVIAVLTGSGDYFSSGNDLNMFQPIPKTHEDLRELALKSKDVLQGFVGAFIDFPKPLVGVVNGPCIGIAGTVLGLMDLVYASDRATFNFPFVQLGQGPEGCSSYVFPRLMGAAKAGELIYLGKKIDAVEAERLGLVTSVVPHENLDSVMENLKKNAKLPKASLLHCKELMRGVDKEILHQVNRKECEMLVDRWSSPETFKAVAQMFLKKKTK